MTAHTRIHLPLSAALLCSALAAHAAHAANRAPTYSTPALLARVDGDAAWHAMPGDDLIAAKLAIGDDGGVMGVVGHGDGQPYGYYLYSPHGRWRALLDGQAYGIPGEPSANPSGHFAFSVGYHALNLVEPGIYVLDTQAGYAAAQPQHFATPISGAFAPLLWDSPVLFADGSVAYGVNGFAGTLLSTGSIWAESFPSGGYPGIFARTTSVDSSSRYTQLCAPTINATQGFLGCAYAGDDAEPGTARPLRIWPSGFSQFYGVMDASHAPGLDDYGDEAYLDPQYGIPTIFSSVGGRVFYGPSYGFGPLLDDSPIRIVRPYRQPLIEIVFESHLDSGDALVALLFDADSSDVRLVRLLGAGDAVTLEDRRPARIEADGFGQVLGPRFAVNTRGDVLLLAHLTAVESNGERDPAGTGLILLERDLFRDGFDGQP